MAKPRVFISSTYYDLKHLRSSLENFVESLGFEAVLSEKGDIAYSPDVPLDESCYREAGNCDIFVLIVGGRYGSGSSSEEKKPDRAFFERYDSITKEEYRHALDQNTPTYILIDSGVYAEHRTFLKNKDNKGIEYAHVDSVNVFHLIEYILSQPKNNPVFSFEKYSQVEDWLKEQWAGLFKELLGRVSGQQQIATLTTQVSELAELNKTLRRYLESIISKVSPAESEDIIESEAQRLREAEEMSQLRGNHWVDFVVHYGYSLESCVRALRAASSFQNFVDRLRVEEGDTAPARSRMSVVLSGESGARSDLNRARKILALPPLRMRSRGKKKKKKRKSR